MHIERNPEYNRFLILLLNFIALIFKSLSFVYLKIRSLKIKKYPEVFIISADNLSFGGKNDVPLHIDGVMRNAHLFVDGEKVDVSSF